MAGSNPVPSGSSADPVDQLSGDVTTTLTQMRNDFVNQISALKAELKKVEDQSLGAKIEAAISKIVKDRIGPLEQEVLKMKSAEVRTSKEESIIDKKILGRPFVFKGEASQSFNDWVHQVSVYMFRVSTSGCAHRLLKWSIKQAVPIVVATRVSGRRTEGQSEHVCSVQWTC